MIDNFNRRLTILVLACIVAAGSSGRAQADQTVKFNRDIRPILSEKCFQCHGPDAATRQADLRLDDPSIAERVLGPEPERSELLERISSDDPSLRMPPPDSHKRLTADERSLLQAWVEQGAVYQPHWSFITPQAPRIPAAATPSALRNPIDAFIMERLDEEGLQDGKLSPPCDKTTYIRRVTLDLTGLPPTPQEVEAFLADDAPGCEERLIDRLLHSVRYGEHMASFWLEAARYADTDGYQNDRYRYMHDWRDWVVLAFNEHRPYDQFVVEQLAGDMLPGGTLKQQIATGFCRNHRINSEDGSIPQEWHVENVVDRVDTFGTVFLGLTVGCARCHDHKYDPVSQREYYQLFAYFNNVPEWGIGPNNGNSPPFITVPDDWTLLAPEEDRPIIPEPVKLKPARDEAGNGLKRPQPGGPETVMVMHELEDRRPTYLLERGLYDQPDTSEELAPAVPAALNPNQNAAPGDRLELAQWLVDPANPLTARVAVNRVWQQFFGRGLVETSDNFGSQGAPPSHPELLDWLAVYFVESGWDLQALQKLILTSATYGQSSSVSEELLQRDPENVLLARGPRFRLPAFVLRDQALYTSGLLVDEVGGLPTKPYMPEDIWSSISNNKYEQDHGRNLYRRSLYTFWRRTIPPPTMVAFNAATRETCSVRADRTNTPMQALTLMNNTIFVESSRFLAERMLRESGESIDDRLSRGFRLITAREPRKDEQELLRRAYEDFLGRFRQEPKAAEQLLSVGEKQRSVQADCAEHAAMTMVASLILNLDESIVRE